MINYPDKGSRNWNHSVAIEINHGEEEKPRNVTFHMNPEFHSFLLLEGLKDLRICSVLFRQTEKKLQISTIFVDKENETLLTLGLDRKFDYGRTYLFEMDLNRNFKSEMTLRFNITKIWPSRKIPVKIFAALQEKDISIPIPSLCANIAKENNIEITIRNSTTTFFNLGRRLTAENTSMISISNLLNLNRSDTLFQIFRIRIDFNETRETFNLTLGKDFDYNQTYQLICSRGTMNHATMDFKFDVTEIVNTKNAASIGILIASAFCLVGIGAALIYKKRKSERTDFEATPTDQGKFIKGYCQLVRCSLICFFGLLDGPNQQFQ